jgi:DNA-binding transcriptional LysR family regulator
MNSDDLALLSELRRNDTYSAAAEALGISHTTVSRRIRDLETHFGARLIERVGDRVVLTAEGESAAKASDAIAAHMLSLERDIAGRDGHLFGHISLTTVDILAWHFMDRLKAFSERYPEIELTISAETTVRSLSRREAEVALRLTNDPEPYLFGRNIGRLDFAPFASRDYATEVGSMEEAVWIDYAGQDCAMRSAPWLKANLPRTRARHLVSTPLIMQRAIEAGLGIGLLPTVLAEKSTELVRLDSGVAFSQDIWLLAPKELRRTARIRALFDVLSSPPGEQGVPSNGRASHSSPQALNPAP